MNNRLVKPSVNFKEQYIDYYMEWKSAGEKMSPGILRNLNPCRFEEMVEFLLACESAKNIPEGAVAQSVFWLVCENDRMVGAVTIRHMLTERLLNTEGHIGAGIRPSERRKGYATILLALALDEMRRMRFQKALVTCNEDNIGSEQAIRNNGGVKENHFREKHGNIVKRYWISLLL